MPISLPPALFASNFPFHIGFGRDLVVSQAGSVLARICPEVVPGAKLDELFRIERPLIEATFQSICESSAELFVLSRLAGSLQLRGQMLVMEHGHSIAFLASPWITEPGALRELGLTLRDFPIHDPIGDFLQVSQSQMTAVSELRQLTGKLNQQREALREALAVLNATLESTADGIMVADTEGRIVNTNRRFLEMWRLPEGAEKFIAPGILREAILPQLVDPQGFSARIASLYAEPSLEGHDIIHFLDGRIFERFSQPHRLGDKVIGRVWSYHDVTESWRASEALRLSEERYRIVAETASDGIVTVDRESRILFANGAVSQIFGYERDELLQLQLTDLMPESMRGAHRMGLRRYTETGRRSMDWRSVQVDGLRKDGTLVPLELSFGESLVEGRRWFTGIIRDVTESRRISQALEESEHRYRSVVDHLKEIVFQADARGRWVFLNPAWSEITGHSVEESLGQPWYKFIHPEDKQRNFEMFQPLVRGEKDFCRHTVRHLTASGQTRWLEVYARMVLDTEGRMTGISGTLTDVTERLDFEARIEKARDEAEAANQAKTHFLANMSHEIRTPLNAIVGMSELMALTKLTPEQREYQETVSTSTESLLHLINDLLDLSKIEAGQVDIDDAVFDPGEICEQAVNMLKTRIIQKGLGLHCYANPALPPRVVGDPNRVRQILVNLIGNALKFTSEGSITLSLAWRIIIGERVELRFDVEDTGIGIEAENRARVFEKFVQLDTSFSSRFSGAGLGLNISRSLAQAMGGSIDLQSEPGKGSCFSLFLTVPRSGRRSVEDFLLLDRCREIKALLVSQPPQLQRALAAWGIAPVDCASESEAESLLLSGTKFGLVVTSGTTVVSAACGIATLHVTAAAMVPARQGPKSWALEAPLVPGKLHQLLCSLLDVAFADPSPNIPAAASPNASAVASPRILVVEDNQENRMLANRILASVGCQVDIAVNGLEAVAKAHDTIYDLILMDLRMPEMDGFQAAAIIRKQEKADGVRVPIIALTAHALEDYRDQAFAAGMDDYLTKPYRREQLLAMVDRWVDPHPLILLADDSPEIHALVRGYLKSGGYRLVSASSGPEALREFTRRNVSLVFLDLGLGESDGLAVAREILAVPRVGRVPIVALTGNSGRSVRERCLAAGCLEHLEKPVRRSAFLQIVERYTGAASSRPWAEAGGSQPEAEVVMVDPLLADLIPGYLHEARARAAEAADRLQQGDQATARRIAHQLKGSGGGYGFDTITALAAPVELALKEGNAAEAAEKLRALRAYLEAIRWEVATEE